MQDTQFIGYVVSAVVTLGAFISVIWKFTQPINDLRVVIQKLNDNIDNLKSDNQAQDNRLDKHGHAIDKLNGRVDKLEVRVDMYHKN